MCRPFGWALVGGLLLAMASTATAQVSVTIGNPYRGTGVTIGGYGVAPGYAYGNPYYGSPSSYTPYVNIAPTYGVSTGYGYPGAYPSPGYVAAYPSAPSYGYNSAYSGYTYPGTISYGVRGYSRGYGPTYGYPSYGYNSYGYGYPRYGYGRSR